METNSKKLMPSQQFIGIIHKEYLQCTEQANDKSINLATQKPCYATPTHSLVQHIGNGNKWCSHCKHQNHNDADCLFLNNAPPCNFCQLKGHHKKNHREKKRQEMNRTTGKRERLMVKRRERVRSRRKM